MCTQRGFTLIELLVTIAIIGLLSSIVLTSLNIARAKARDAKRLSDMHQVELALGLYFSDNGAYPNTGLTWWGACSAYGSHTSPTGPTAWVPSIAPAYISSVPFDPKPLGTEQCYLYRSNGTDYMLLMGYYTVENATGASNPAKRLIEAPQYPSFSAYTSGAIGW